MDMPQEQNAQTGPNTQDYQNIMVQGFGLGNIKPDDAVGQAVLVGLGKVAEGLNSKDLSERARASRTTFAMIAVHRGEAVPSFAEADYSAEELQAGLMPLATAPELKEFITDRMREGLHIPEASDEAPVEENTFGFAEDEAPVAATLVGFGLAFISEMKHGKRTLVRPNDIWSDEILAELTPGMTEGGILRGDKDSQRALLENTRAKLLHILEMEIDIIEKAQKQAKRELADL
jgi:hypothetical protein